MCLCHFFHLWFCHNTQILIWLFLLIYAPLVLGRYSVTRRRIVYSFVISPAVCHFGTAVCWRVKQLKCLQWHTSEEKGRFSFSMCIVLQPSLFLFLFCEACFPLKSLLPFSSHRQRTAPLIFTASDVWEYCSGSEARPPNIISVNDIQLNMSSLGCFWMLRGPADCSFWNKCFSLCRVLCLAARPQKPCQCKICFPVPA